MAKVGLIKFLALFILLSPAWAQKVKYKDIFGLLSTKQYEQAEPFLKKYLLENDDNPNAFLFMGMILQEKSLKTDILKQTAMAIAYMDSAILYYDKAYKTIDEREVRKNKEYYQAYNRRDLRTGEFGVKLSDIQLDLEKRISGLKERIDRTKMVKHYFALADSLYKSCNTLYGTLQQSYDGEQQLYLRADDNTLKNLSVMSVRFDSCIKAFENYKASSSNLGRTGYNQTLTLTEINDFKKEGSAVADFYQEDLKVWHYKKFADKVKQTIEKEVVPMRENLIRYDIEINKLRERLNNDSVSVRSDLTKLIDRLLFDQLKKFDPEPLPMEVFSMKVADLEYRSSLYEHKPLMDSADLHLRLSLVNTEIELLNKLDSISTRLASQNIEQEALDYSHFVTNTYGNTIVLQSYVRALKEYAQREKRKKNAELELRQQSLKWLVDGADSIPLNLDGTSAKYKPLFTSEEKFTIGLHYADTLNVQGYLFNINPKRVPDLKVMFPVDKAAFKPSSFPVTRALTYADADGQVYYVLIYADQPSKEKYPATLAKIYRSDGLAWSNNYALSFIPSSISFKTDTGELVIMNDAQQTVIDKNGKLLR